MLAVHEATAENVEIEIPEEIEQEDYQPLTPPLKKTSKIPLFTLAAIFIAILFIAYKIPTPISQTPIPIKVVATLTDAMNCQWADTGKVLVKGDDVLNETRKLLSGFISLSFNDGAQVILEGPAEFTPISTEKMILLKGKAYAHVPDMAMGFTIDTANLRVVDLGTAFGVEALDDGSSEVYVFEGEVNLIISSRNKPKVSEILTKSQARKIDVNSTVTKPIKFLKTHFVRWISSQDNMIWHGQMISLASLAAGGDGITPGNNLSGIDPGSGKINASVQQSYDRFGRGFYSAVPDREFVDGVFVPDPSKGPSLISSMGHRFNGFPTTVGSYWADITTSPELSRVDLSTDNTVVSTEILKVQLDQPTDPDTIPLPVLVIHSNAGITFDLNQIRKRFVGKEIVRFTARCGTAINVPIQMKHRFWVLLDGQRQFTHSQVTGLHTIKAIDIPIRPNQRFLTLATTDGGDGTSFDWAIFEEPILELMHK